MPSSTPAASLYSCRLRARGATARRRAAPAGCAGRPPAHPLVAPCRILVFLQAPGARIELAQALAVIDPHLGEDARGLVRAQARAHRAAGPRLPAPAAADAPAGVPGAAGARAAPVSSEPRISFS